MMDFETFHGEPKEVRCQIKEWLHANPMITILHVAQSVENGILYISIFFELDMFKMANPRYRLASAKVTSDV